MRFCETCNTEKKIEEFIGGRKHCKKCNREKYKQKLKSNFYLEDGSKVCSICDIEKKNSDFRIHRTYCKKCENKKTYNSRKETQSIKNKEYIRLYQKNNRDKINHRIRNYKKERKKNDNLYKCSIMMSQIISNALRLNGVYKSKRSEDIIGLSKSDFKKYIESKFEDWMTWENYGLYNGELNYGWDIDHIIPLSSAKSEEELLNLNNYENLQPLCSYKNRYIKKDNINYNI